MHSLHVWVPLFPSFAEAIRRKYCSCWQQNDDTDGNPIPNVPNAYENEGTFNICGMLDASVYETCRPGSRPDREGPNFPRRENWCIKQRDFYDGHHKYHGIKALTVSFPNGMSTVIGIVSARPHDANILTWSDLDNYLTNLCEMGGLPIYCFYGNNGFLGG